MKAVKGNKEYMIDESQKKAYQDAGFDIYADGKQIAYGRGKTVPYGDYADAAKKLEASEAENKKLKEKIAALEADAAEKKPSSKKAGD